MKKYILILLLSFVLMFTLNSFAADDNKASYSVIGARCTDYEIQQLGYEKVAPLTWKFELTEYLDRYVWVENNIVFAAGLIFHDTAAFGTINRDRL